MKKWILILAVLLTACKTQQINNQTTKDHNKIQIDSIYIDKYIKDTSYVEKEIYVEVKGDCKDSIVTQTIYKEVFIKDDTQQSSVTVDTLYVYKDNTIIQEVEKKLNWYHQTWIGFGWVFLIIILGKVGWIIIKRRL